ncbi:MAG: hypothetical protein IKW27_04690, partial [Bacteroidales bacterium]|nr:hypothetical protein [Bacteroidales bacterium]
MKSFFDRVLSALNIRGRDWVILILSLLLAFSVWLIHNLSLRYNAFLSVNVSAVSNLQGHSNVSAGDAEVTARCRATGYKVLKGYLRSGRIVKVTFDPSALQHYVDDRYFVTSDRLSEYSHLIFGDEVSVEYFVSDTLFFRFPAVNSKRVPVVPVTSLSFRDQYVNNGPLEMIPDSVTVYGEPFLLDNISSVNTKPINYFDISDDIHGIVKLEPIRGVRLSATEAHYSMEVTRFVDVTVDVPVDVVNVPADKALLVFPSTVKVLLRCEFPLLADPYGNVR